MTKKRLPTSHTEAGLLVSASAAVRVGFSVSTLKKGRQGLGPAKDLEYVQIGKSVRYTPEACDRFIAKQRVRTGRDG